MAWLMAALLLPTVVATAQRSPFNGMHVLPADSTGSYRIIIGGHFHGESSNRSGYPASTLLANIDSINALGANLFLSTGDLYMDAKRDSARYAQALFSKLRVPFFNAPGNHDRSERASQPAAFTISIGYLPELDTGGHQVLRVGSDSLQGQAPDTAFVRAGREVFKRAKAFGPDSLLLGLGACVVFDLEASDGSLTEHHLQELNFWRSALTDTNYSKLTGRRLLIISHRPIWSEDDERYSDLFKENTRSLAGNNFQKEVYPILEDIAKHAQVYWISGSLGGGAPSSIFFQQHAPNITYIQCAIRDEPRDALLIADVRPDSVHWSALSLTGQELLAPQAYDAAWWRAHARGSEPFNWRLLPYLARKTVSSPAFWWGAAFAVLFVFLARRLWQRG